MIHMNILRIEWFSSWIIPFFHIYLDKIFSSIYIYMNGINIIEYLL